MSNSPLVVHTNLSPNCTKPRNHKIDTITIHCVVGQCTAESLGNVFKPASRRGSSNYGVDKDGRVGMYVEEKDRSWCTSSGANDNRAVTIEVASDTTHPYKVTDKAYKALVELCADICKRNGIAELKWKGDKSLIGQVDKQNMTVHRWFANTACPGDYLYGLHGKIAEDVNQKLGTASKPTLNDTPTPTLNATPAQTTTGSAEYKVGDLVHFTGCLHYTSSYKSGVAKACKAGIAKVLHLSEGKPHPYSLKAAGGGATVYGWVNASDILCKATGTRPKTYKVVKGDTISKIAKAHGTTANILIALNGITNKNHIYVGQIIKLP